jgi:carboxypeptidase C (cathepsin A)
MFLLLSLLSLTSLVRGEIQYSSEALADEIKNLPGAEKLDFSFRQFSGYLPISSTKNVHYWFVESQGNAEKDPIAMWTNGGPGCSGMIGFFTEQGPFRPQADLSLALNDYSWNKLANMFFVEQPCGVGYSYSTSEHPMEDYRFDDEDAAKDNYIMVVEFFKRFPQFRTNDFYLSSESYGGHYLPALSKEIVDANAAAITAGESEGPVPNFKGFAVGNPYTTFYSGIPAAYETLWGHQLIAKPTWDGYQENCVNRRPYDVRNMVLLFYSFFLTLFLSSSALCSLFSLHLIVG